MKLFDTTSVRGADFIKKVEKVGKKHGITVHFDERRGKGSHGTLYYGNCFTVVQDRKKELPQGTLAAMLKQLGLSLQDLH